MKNIKLHPLLLALVMFSMMTVGILLGRLSPLYGKPLFHTQNRISHTENVFEPENAEMQKININTASAEELMLLPGIGPTLSDRIIKFREESGFFTAPEDLMKIKGIGPDTYNKIAEYITVGG